MAFSLSLVLSQVTPLGISGMGPKYCYICASVSLKYSATCRQQ